MIKVVAAIIENKNKVIMLARKKAGKALAGFWEFPGGKIEKGETPEESLIREIKEEMNLNIDVISYFDTNIHDYGDKQVKLIAYKAKIKNGELKLKDHDQVRWVKIQELNQYALAPADIPFVQSLKIEE